MQCDLLMSNSRDPKMVELVKGKIGYIFDGSLPHCADSLKLGLKKAVDLKKKERQPDGAKLRCANGSCAWYNNHPPYSSVGPNAYCRMCIGNCRGSYYLQCVGCGYSRTSSYPSCQRCGEEFI